MAAFFALKLLRISGGKVCYNSINKDLAHQMLYKRIESGIESMLGENMDINQDRNNEK